MNQESPSAEADVCMALSTPSGACQKRRKKKKNHTCKQRHKLPKFIISLSYLSLHSCISISIYAQHGVMVYALCNKNKIT